jgi:CRP-like cAMP-binding protein
MTPTSEKFNTGDVIIREGATENFFFILQDGAVEVRKGDKKIADIVERGSIFGEMSAIMGQPRQADIVAALPCTVTRVYTGIDEIIDHYPSIAKKIMSALVNRLIAMNVKFIEH